MTRRHATVLDEVTKSGIRTWSHHLKIMKYYEQRRKMQRYVVKFQGGSQIVEVSRTSTFFRNLHTSIFKPFELFDQIGTEIKIFQSNLRNVFRFCRIIFQKICEIQIPVGSVKKVLSWELYSLRRALIDWP